MYSSTKPRSKQTEDFPWLRAHWAGRTDIRFSSPQPDTSLHCESTDTGLVHWVMCLSTSQLLGKYQAMLLSNRGTHV